MWEYAHGKWHQDEYDKNLILTKTGQRVCLLLHDNNLSSYQMAGNREIILRAPDMKNKLFTAKEEIFELMKGFNQPQNRKEKVVREKLEKLYNSLADLETDIAFDAVDKAFNK